MIDNVYRNAFKEVNEILKNTDKELVDKIPQKFMNFIKDNMNENYETNIRNDVDIDKQKLLNETEAILSLIYRSYWATDEEKREFTKKDENELTKNNQEENIYNLFEEKKNINKVTVDENLKVIKKESLFKSFINKLKHFLKIKKN